MKWYPIPICYVNKLRFIHIDRPSLKSPNVHINNGSHTLTPINQKLKP